MTSRDAHHRAGRAAPAGAYARFLLRVAIGFAAALALRALGPGLERGAIRATLASLTVVFRALHGAPAVAGDVITSGGVAFRVVGDCTPLMPTLLIVVAMLAFPAPWRARLAGIAAAAVVLWAYNLFRVVVLIGVMARWPRAFDFVHVYLWQTVTLVVVVATFMAWLSACARPAPPRAPA